MSEASPEKPKLNSVSPLSANVSLSKSDSVSSLSVKSPPLKTNYTLFFQEQRKMIISESQKSIGVKPKIEVLNEAIQNNVENSV